MAKSIEIQLHCGHTKKWDEGKKIPLTVYCKWHAALSTVKDRKKLNGG